MALSRRTFLAAAAAGLAACSKSVHRVVGSASTTTPSTAAAPKETTTTKHTGPAEVVYNGPRDRKMVAFTFHGSGDPNLPLQMLDLTKRLSAPLTGLAVASWLQQHPHITHRLLRAGHGLGNDTDTPPH